METLTFLPAPQLDRPLAEPRQPGLADRLSSTTAVVLTLLVFLNAALLFSVEPMFSKLVLPFLGGTPSVWNTCLVFFQAALLVGYGYAHALTRFNNRRARTTVHIVLLALSCLALPLAVKAHGAPPPGSASIIWLLGLLIVSLGAPFVMLSSGAPLAQQWLADSGHPDSGDPYFLYSASNLGSLVALLSYPLIIEPQLTLSAQRAAWSVGYLILVISIAVCFLAIASSPPRRTRILPTSSRQDISIRERVIWIVYAAVPAALLVAVTTYISTDVAAVPLLWILPLALYLLTFVIVFSRRPVIRQSWMTRAAPHVLIIIAIPFFWGLRLPGLIGIVAHLTVLFIIAMVCHGELARRRPDASQLTEFFVWVGLGGFIGGSLIALGAPVVFNRVYEYPIIIASAAMLIPAATRERRLKPTDILLPLAIGFALILLARDMRPLPALPALLLTILLGIAVFSFRARPLRFGLALAAVFVAGQLLPSISVQKSTVLEAKRSFFGVYQVSSAPGSRVIQLYHGTTLHGAQSVDPSRRLVPLTYYHPDGPAGDVFLHTPPATKAVRSVGVVGLGAGSLACYGRLGERWTFYEIDPVVARIALDPRFFTYLRDCPPSVRIVLGDARLTIAKAQPASFDILVLDAFSSDAIPVHLLTREAFRLYVNLLAPSGLIAVHISNEHLDLEPVIAAVARDLHLASLVRRDFFIPESDAAQGRTQAVWAVLARSPADLGTLDHEADWVPPRGRTNVSVWTDDFSNIIRVFDWH